MHAARVDAGLTQEEVAKKLGITPQTIIAWEKYDRYPNAIQFRRLCNLYDRSMDDIFLPVDQLKASK